MRPQQDAPPAEAEENRRLFEQEPDDVILERVLEASFMLVEIA